MRNCAWAIVLFYLAISGLLPTYALAQDLPCVELNLHAVGDSLSVATDPALVRVRAHRPPATLDALCVSAAKEGYYRILTGVLYSQGQTNESYFLQVRYPDSTFAPVCDPNAGPYRVVADTSALAFSATRDAGQFYLRQGQNVIVLNHYLLIQDQYPQFLNPPGERITGAKPESVHIFRFVFVYLGACTLPCDVGLVKRASEDTVLAGGRLQFELFAQNNGPHTARRINLWEHFPPELAQVHCSPTPDSTAGLMAVWRLDSLEVGQTFHITVVGMVADTLEDSVVVVTNRGIVVAINDTSASNDTAEVAVVAIQPAEELPCDLALRKVADVDTVVAGQVVTYTLSLTNVGPGPARECVLQDTLPPLVVPVSFVPEPESFLHGVAVWRFAEIAAGQETTVLVSARVSAPLLELPALVVNRAHVHVASDTNRTNDVAEVVTVVVPHPCEVWVSKAAEVDTVEAGSVFAYRLAVGNEGPGPAYRIAVVDTLPVHVAVTEFGMRPDSVEGRVVWWWIDSLGVGERREWAVWVRVDSLSSGQMRNVVVVNAAGDLVPGDDEAEKAVIVRPRPVRPVVCDVRMVKRADRDSVWAGGRIGYELEVSNLGPGVARQVVVV
ncbi:MAG: DUF11 domain-containing protein, partial [candidate division KSB1 bacterium]|nr:DUF11 domain-containing protein [candidate division KSB1 bacterium]